MGKPWTSNELNTLKQIYYNFDKDKIEKLLPDRTWKVIINKANSIGLSRKKYYKNIDFRIKRSRNSKTRKYNINDCYFDKIDSEDKAYWVGFILADGNVYKNVLTIALKISDRIHLDKFNKCINSNYPIKDNNLKKNPESRLSINSVYMISSLKKLGIVEKKSEIAKPIKSIPNKFEKDFWRGMVDGDGSIITSKDKSKYSISLVGTKDICNGFKEFCLNFSDTIANVIHVKKNLYKFSVSGKKSIEIIKTIYMDSTINLDRKYNDAIDILEKYKKMKSIYGDGLFTTVNFEKSFGYNHKDLLEEWNSNLNTLNPFNVSCQSHKCVNWICKKCGNKWKDTIQKRTLWGVRCPECRKEWNDKDNLILEEMYSHKGKPINDICVYFNKSISAVKSQINRLNLKRKPNLNILRKSNKTGHVGVSIGNNGKYNSSITVLGRQFKLGEYNDIKMAISIRKEAELMKSNKIYDKKYYDLLRKRFKNNVR